MQKLVTIERILCLLLPYVLIANSSLWTAYVTEESDLLNEAFQPVDGEVSESTNSARIKIQLSVYSYRFGSKTDIWGAYQSWKNYGLTQNELTLLCKCPP